MKKFKEFIESRIVENTQVIPKGIEGECYKNVEDYLLQNDLPDALVVHGEVTSQGKTMKHAWILDKNTAIDPTTGIITSKEKYYDILNPKESYTLDQYDAMKVRIKTKNFGEWTKDEIENVLGRRI